MPDVERRTGNGEDFVQKIRTDIQREVQEAKAGTAEEQQRKMAELATLIQREIRDVENPAREVVRDIKTKGKVEHHQEGSRTLRTIIRAAEAAKAGIPIATKESARRLLSDLTEKSLTESTASAIETNLKDYLLGTKDIVFSSAGQQKSEFEKAIDDLNEDNTLAANILKEVLIDHAADFEKTADEVKARIGEPKSEREQIEELTKQAREQASEGSFENQWSTLYSQYFQAEDIPLLKALQNASDFVDYVAKKKDLITDTLKRERPEADKKELKEETGKRLSDELKENIGDLFSKIYHKLDKERTSEFFEKVTSQDYFSGIDRVTQDIKRRLSVIDTYAVAHEADVEHKLEGIEFIREAAEQPTEEMVEEKKPDGETITKKPRTRLKPLLTPKTVNFKEFIAYVDLLMDQYIDVRRYTHNARALLLHPSGKEGFWAQLKEFSENFKMVDYETMLLLPDSKYFTRALALYDKFLEEEFASHDGQHTSDMFTELPGEPYHFNKLEKEVLEQLKNSFRKEDGTLDVSEDKLVSAIAMAVGASRGIFLNEVEKAAYADPPLSTQGKMTFRSYYTNDNAALMAFNPVLHHSYRFQNEAARFHPLYFLPVEGTGGAIWDHKRLWDRRQKFQESFLNGRNPLGKEKLFIDFCTNIGRIGGPVQRNGWRSSSWFETYYIYGDDGKTLDHLKTWKNLENVGFEAIKDWIHGSLSETYQKSRMNEDFLKTVSPERTALFQHIFKKYFNQDPTGLNDYLSTIRGQANEIVNKDIMAGKISPSNIREQVELETAKIFLYRSLARIVAQRFPSKFIRISRDRLSDDGTSDYKKLKEALGISDQRKFDSIIKDFLLAEDTLRKNVSEQMRAKIIQLKKEGKVDKLDQLNVLGDFEYKLSEEKISSLLKGKLSPEKINQVAEFYKKLEELYSNNPVYLDKFGNFIRDETYKFTFGLEELDLGFVPFRSAGPRVLPRAIGDIATTEQGLSDVVKNFPDMLQKVAIGGKGDFSEIVNAIAKAKDATIGIIGNEYGQIVAHHLAAMAINYFKKDTRAKWLFGIFGSGRINSLAGEIAQRSTGVWEWDARETDKFIIALENADVLKKSPYLWQKQPEYEPVYIHIPFTNKMIKLPKGFNKRKPDLIYSAQTLRREFGADGIHIAFELINTVLPVALLLLAWQLMQKASKDDSKK